MKGSKTRRGRYKTRPTSGSSTPSTTSPTTPVPTMPTASTSSSTPSSPIPPTSSIPTTPTSTQNSNTTIGNGVLDSVTGEEDRLKLSTKVAKVLSVIDGYSPDDKDDFTLQAERKHGLRAPAAILNTRHSIADLRKGGQRRFFERKDGETEDSVLRKGLDVTYIATQVGTQITPDEDQDEESSVTATRKLIHGTTDVVQMVATAEKKPNHEKLENTEKSDITESSSDTPIDMPEAPVQKPFVKPSKSDIEQYKRVKTRHAATMGKPPVKTFPKDMSKDEMREVIRETNKEIMALERHPQSIQRDVKWQQQVYHTAKRTSYRNKRKTGLHHGISKEAKSLDTTIIPSPVASIPPVPPKPVIPATKFDVTNPAMPTVKKNQKSSWKTPKTPTTLPLSPLHHGTPPSLDTPKLYDDSKSTSGTDKKKTKTVETKIDKKQINKPDIKTEKTKRIAKKDSKLNHLEKTDKESKLTFDNNQQSNTLLAQGSNYIMGKVADKIHSEISNAEKDFGNTGVESVHKAETVAEKAHSLQGKVKKLQHYIKNRHTRRINKAKAKALKHEGRLARKALDSDPTYKGKPLSKTMQKMRIKRQYAQAARAAKTGKTLATSTKATATAAKSATLTAKMLVMKAKAVAAAKALILLCGKVILAIVLLIILLVLVVSCMSMLGGGFMSILDGLSYQADMDDITTYSVYMTELELDLQEDIHDALSPTPPADEVVFVVIGVDGTTQTFSFPPSITGYGGVFLDGSQFSPPSHTITPAPIPSLVDLQAFLPDISHCPIELMAYLTIVHGDFSNSNMNEVLQDLFDEVFQLTYSDENTTLQLTVPVENFVTDEEGFTEQVPPFTTTITIPLHVRTVTLEVNGTISDVIQNRLENMYSGGGDNPYLEWFEFLMETRGLRQFVGSPFENDWTGAVTSIFGYRLHPITGNREMHTGIDVGKPTGTPLLGGLSDGVVITAGDMGGYGLTVIIQYVDSETGQGVRVLYAHMDTIDVSVGDVLEMGQVIGTVGATGTATGAHLHMEVLVTEDFGGNWRRINPAFFVEPFTSDDSDT